MEIKDAINKSLFFLGAGASFDAGCKLSNGMLIDLKERISSKSDLTFNKPEKEALKFLLSCLEYHSEWRTLETSGNFKFVPNIEELALLIRRVKNREHFLPYPITGNWADKLSVLEAEYTNLNSDEKYKDSLFDALDYKIKTKLLNEWLVPGSYNFLSPLTDFLNSYPQEDFRFDFFSLNNDMVIENFCKENFINPWRGFVSGEWRGASNGENINDFGRINLYKLHGSLDWVRLTTGDFKEQNEFLNQEDKDNIEESNNPYVIFGQGTKTFSVEPFFNLIQHFKQSLCSKYYFFIIGYSFFDPYINNLLIDAVRGSSKKIIIINPYFGPESLKYGDGYQTDSYKRIIYPKDKSALDLAGYIEEIQRNSFYSELPEFNIKKLNAKAIEYLPIGMGEFLSSYFPNKGEIFLNLITSFEDERISSEEPF